MRVSQCVFLAMTGRQPEAGEIAPPWVFPEPEELPVPPELREITSNAAFDLLFAGMGLPVPT